MERKNKLILEFTEFNLQRMNSDSVPVAPHVDNPSLSLNAFDKHQSVIRTAMSRINDILFNLKGTSGYSKLRSSLALKNQDITNIRIQRILKEDNVNYNVYLVITIDEVEYWSKIEGINKLKPVFKSEVFKNQDLHQPREWVIKIQGTVIKTIKQWLKPEPGKYSLLKEGISCRSSETGKKLILEKGVNIQLVRSYDDKHIIKQQDDYYELVDDNFIYFNWWFEKVD
jgi:hypothetical protein